MKIKEIDRTANIAWSPPHHHPIYIAAGTAAQQLDATFSTTAALEIYSLNLTEPGLDMMIKGSVVSDFRFHKIAWGCHDLKGGNEMSGVLVGGADAGNLFIYDPVKLLEGDRALVFQGTKHSGPVRSLDFNNFQHNLLASGSTESEIYIWDLNNPNTPMSPGAKSQPPDDVTCVAWNKQVQHILASTFSARCVVWDLRKNEPIIKVSDSTSRIRYKMLAWHPDVATQLCLASEDDHSPIIQLWDLRYATAPIKTLENHQRGVLSVAWCPQDPDLLLSCGKDNRVLCWNPNSNVAGGEVVYELSSGNQWSFDVLWCPRNPAVIACASFDGHIGIYSLMGGQQQVQPSAKITEAFPESGTPFQPPVPQPSQRAISMPLKKPPKWLRKPVGASFGFGGKLITFSYQPQGQLGQLPNVVYISQVVTEPQLLQRTGKLESALSTGNLAEFCTSKVQSATDSHTKMEWSFLQANFEESPRSRMLSLLNYDPQTIAADVTNTLSEVQSNGDAAEEFGNLSLIDVRKMKEGDVPKGDVFESVTAKGKELEVQPFTIRTDENNFDSLLNKALLTGNVELAVELCLQDGRWADALILSQAGGSALLRQTQARYFKSMNKNSAKLISAVVTSSWNNVVETCDIDCWKEALASVLTYARPEEFASLCESLGERLETEKNGTMVKNAILCYICAGNLEKLANCWLRIHHDIDDPASLQELIEQVMILRKAVEQTGGQGIVPGGKLSTLLGKYAALLASQGSLKSAVAYLTNEQDPTLDLLRDRIYKALGMQSQPPFRSVEVQSSVPKAVPSQSMGLARRASGPLPPTPPGHFQPQMSAPHPEYPTYSSPPSLPGSAPYAYPPPPQQYQAPVGPPLLGTPPQPSPLNAFSAGQMGIPQSVATGPPPPPPPAAPADGTTPLYHAKGHHLAHKYPSHLHDPSVYSESQFPLQSSGFYQPTSQFPPYSESPPAYSQPFYSTDADYGGPSPMYTQANSLPNNAPSSAFNNQGPPQAAASTQPTMASQPKSFQYGEMKHGWNDPPPVKPSSKTPKATFEPLAPITAPVMGVPEPVQNPVAPVSSYAPPVYGMPHEPPPMPTQQQQPPAAPTPEPAKQKGPIPPEHQVLQEIFDTLRSQCHQVAANPQVKRKLDDVARKLESLYDKLRGNELSNSTTHGLHQIIQVIQQGDYQAALAIHSHLVSSTNFSETSTFMPGLKVLLQVAQQLNVYIQ